MHILIVRLSAIGDIIHTLPALAEIKRNLPEASISWVAEERSAEILRGNPLIDDLIEIDTRSLKGGKVIEKILLDVSRQARDVRRNKYDVTIDFQGLIKSAIVSKVSGATLRFGFDRRSMREPAGRIFYTGTVKVPQDIHVIRRNIYLAAGALGFAYDDKTLDFPVATDEGHRAEASSIVSQTNGKFALLNPAGGWVTKLWHAEKFGALADRVANELGLSPVIVTGPNEAELADRVRQSSTSSSTVFAEPSLKGFYELARRAAVYFGGDTGPTHLAIAAGAPVVGIFGPTEWWRNGSLAAGDICVEREGLPCRVDCHRRSCNEWICMDISVDTVFAALKKRIETAHAGRL